MGIKDDIFKREVIVFNEHIYKWNPNETNVYIDICEGDKQILSEEAMKILHRNKKYMRIRELKVLSNELIQYDFINHDSKRVELIDRELEKITRRVSMFHPFTSGWGIQSKRRRIWQ